MLHDMGLQNFESPHTASSPDLMSQMKTRSAELCSPVQILLLLCKPCKLCATLAGMADFFAEGAHITWLMSFVSSMLALEDVHHASITGTAQHTAAVLSGSHARSASVLTAHECSRQCGVVQHFLSMDSIINRQPVVVLDEVQLSHQSEPAAAQPRP